MKKGIPIVVSAPSGGGKSTLVTVALKKLRRTVRSISCTTREPRSGERHGRDYYFISLSEFKRRIKRKDFLEWAQVHNQFYGTPLQQFKNKLNRGWDVFLTIDPQGAQSIRNLFPHAVFVFVVPPSWSVLLNRLKKRGSHNKLDLHTRLKNARNEIKMISHYDYLIVNDRLSQAVEDLIAIVRSEHRSIRRMAHSDVPFLK